MRGDDELQWLVLSHPSDPSAPWVWAGLRERGIVALAVTAEELAFSTSLTHRLVGTDASFRARLPSGAELGAGALRGTVNRLVSVPDDHLATASHADRAYARQELHALFVSFLHALPGVVLNRASARGLSGPWMAPAEWCVAAGRAGLPVARYSLRSSEPLDQLLDAAERRVYVVGGRAVTIPAGEVPPAAVELGCRQLARACGVGLLAIDFVASERGRWTFAGASTTPDLRSGGAPLLDALALALAAT